MSVQQTIEHRALALVSASNCLTLPSDTRKIARFCGFEIKHYSKCRHLIQSLELVDYANDHPAFSVKEADKHYICLSDSLNADSERKAIAHEIGHIILGHLEHASTAQCSDEQEQAAEEFALHLLAPLPIVDRRKVDCPENIKKLTKLSFDDSRLVYRRLEEYRSRCDNDKRAHDLGDRAERMRTDTTSGCIRNIILAYVAVFISLFLLWLSPSMGRHLDPVAAVEPTAAFSSPTTHGETSNDTTTTTLSTTSTTTTTTLPTTTSTIRPITTTTADTTVITTTTTTTSLPTTTTSTTAKDTRKITGPAEPMVYWTDAGRYYHLYFDCQSLKNSVEIHSGSIDDADKERLCKFCERRS